MKNNYLFPRVFEYIGYVLLILGIFLGILFLSEISLDFLKINVVGFFDNGFNVNKTDITDELTAIFLILGGLFIPLAKTKHEDEFILKIRLKSLVYAVYLNFTLVILTVIFIYEFSFLDVMMYNLFSLPLFFAIIFKWMLYKFKRTYKYEK
ncbi:MAG: hypothetical protein ACEPOW_05355 [Bacteroidales bacterium]